MIITCPNCQTNYQLAQKAIGSAGRKVLCANCRQTWKAMPLDQENQSTKPKLVSKNGQITTNSNDDKIFSKQDEEKLDAQFSKIEQIEKNNQLQQQVLNKVTDSSFAADDDKLLNDKRANDLQTKPIQKTSQLDKGLSQKAKKVLNRRKNKIAQNMPLNKIKRQARIWMLLFLIIILAGGYIYRNLVVQAIPQFAIIYKVLGQEVNVVGLDFTNVKTLLIKENNVEKLLVTAKIRNITNRQINVPAIIVNIIDADNISLNEWSIKPTLASLAPREQFEFEAQLKTIPEGIDSVKLSFAK